MFDSLCVNGVFAWFMEFLLLVIHEMGFLSGKRDLLILVTYVFGLNISLT